MLVTIFMQFYKLSRWFMMSNNYHQQTLPSLTFASPFAKLNSVNGLGVTSMLSLLKSTHAFKQKFSSGLEQTVLTFKLTHITFNHGACSLHLGLEQLKDRTIKSSTISQVLCSTIVLEFFISFQNKTQRFYCMTLSSISIYVVFVDRH